MRSLAYGIAVLAALGIAIAIALVPGETEQTSGDVPNVSATPASANVMSEPGKLVLSVPEMHCEFACFPTIKETLEETATVNEVALAEQKEEGTIDNRQVIVQYDAGFDVDAAIKLLDSKGFAKSEVVQ
ncbi:MAG: heavy-metal-associated domain-containing protein [Pirellulaceae bacterium]|nr:heavy-metal-associated domain-containing protein [Pirellulaceae bacterium]